MRRTPRLAPCLCFALWQLGTRALATGACCALTFATAASASEAQPLAPTAVEIRVPAPPSPAHALGRQHLVYELHLTNFGADPVTLRSVRVRDGSGNEVASSEAADLARRYRAVGEPGSPTMTLAPGGRSIVYQWLTLSPQAQPLLALVHEVVFSAGPERTPDTVWTAPTSVAAAPSPAIESPVGPGRWVTVRAPSNESGHRRSLVVLGGEAHIPERFAVDWVRLGDDGRFFSGDPRENASWYGYAEPVFAVAAGRVVLVRDGLPERAPFGPEPVIPYTPETVTGNTVVVDIGAGRFAVYAHLKLGSVSVEEGDRVREGQSIGQIGNSGHSLAPHLHFHIEDRPDPLQGEGLPFELTAYRLIGRLDSVPEALQGTPWAPSPSRPARAVARETPLENMVVEIQ